MKTIYNTYVEMESQEQCDRMKQLCIDNGLPYSKFISAFTYDKTYGNNFYYTILNEGHLFTILYDSEHKEKITEQQFIKLLQDERN